MARLTEELSSANENLKDRVRIRTVELREARAHTEAIIEQLPSGLVEFDESFSCTNKSSRRTTAWHFKEAF